MGARVCAAPQNEGPGGPSRLARPVGSALAECSDYQGQLTTSTVRVRGAALLPPLSVSV